MRVSASHSNRFLQIRSGNTDLFFFSKLANKCREKNHDIKTVLIMTKTCRLIKFFIFIFYSFCSRSFLKRNPFLNKHSSSNQKPGFEIWIHRLNSGALYEKKANITQDLVKVSIVRTMSAGLVEKL